MKRTVKAVGILSGGDLFSVQTYGRAGYWSDRKLAVAYARASGFAGRIVNCVITRNERKPTKRGKK